MKTEKLRKILLAYANKNFTTEVAIEDIESLFKETPNELPTEKVTRIEVINHKDRYNAGRVYSHWESDNKIEAQLQDNERTLKIFISKR